MKEKKPHKTIKQLLDEAGLQPTNADWEKMQSMLDKQLPVSGGKANPFTSWHTWLITTGVVITGIVGYFLIKNISAGKKDSAIHKAGQVQAVNKANAAKDTTAIYPGKEGNIVSGNQQAGETKKPLNNAGRPGTSGDVSATVNPASTSSIVSNSGDASANNAVQQPGTTAASNTNTGNQKHSGIPTTPGVSPSTNNNAKQVNDSSLTVNHRNNSSVKNSKDSRIKTQQGSLQNSVSKANSKQQASDKTRSKPANSITADTPDNGSRQGIAKNNKTNNTVPVGIDTAAQNTSRMNRSMNNNTPDMAKQPISRTADPALNNTAQNQPTAKNNIQNSTGKKGSVNTSKSNAAANNPGFAAGLQLSPLQLNLNGSKKVDINYVPAVHAQYAFNRIGVGVTVFPFVTNSMSRNKFYTHTDTTFSTDTLNPHSVLTTSEYYTQKISSYKAAANISYQLSNKILLEAGVGVQHLTSLKSRLHQDIRWDSLGILINSSNSTVKLKSTDSLFKQSTQNTGFLVFNIWYTAKQWQFGVGYSQDGKAWLKNTSGKGASQLQLNIRYLFDFRKRK